MDTDFQKILIDSVLSPEDVIKELIALNTALPASKIGEIAYFNRAYIVVTKKIHEASKNGIFSNPIIMANLEVAFAKRYFEALNQYATTGKLPPKWQRVKGRIWRLRRPASLSLIVGAHTHIMYDLLPALQRAVNKPDQFKEDYFKVNNLLLEISQEIIESYHEPNDPVRLIKNRFSQLYTKPIMYMILHWRTKIWDRFKS